MAKISGLLFSELTQRRGDAEISKEVDGKTYTDVVVLESESKIDMNGNLISTNFFTKYYYAKSIGLIMTTSSMGDVHTLQKYELN